ncbi:hypothetical protein LTR17_018775 [Elasticomyces elasticus]|nr:hypothetical protein LTR17_018775 [Elasticomyces elasticus]
MDGENGTPLERFLFAIATEKASFDSFVADLEDEQKREVGGLVPVIGERVAALQGAVTEANKLVNELREFKKRYGDGDLREQVDTLKREKADLQKQLNERAMPTSQEIAKHFMDFDGLSNSLNVAVKNAVKDSFPPNLAQDLARLNVGSSNAAHHDGRTNSGAGARGRVSDPEMPAGDSELFEASCENVWHIAVQPALIFGSNAALVLLTRYLDQGARVVGTDLRDDLCGFMALAASLRDARNGMRVSPSAVKKFHIQANKEEWTKLATALVAEIGGDEETLQEMMAPNKLSLQALQLLLHLVGRHDNHAYALGLIVLTANQDTFRVAIYPPPVLGGASKPADAVVWVYNNNATSSEDNLGIDDPNFMVTTNHREGMAIRREERQERDAQGTKRIVAPSPDPRSKDTLTTEDTTQHAAKKSRTIFGTHRKKSPTPNTPNYLLPTTASQHRSTSAASIRPKSKGSIMSTPFSDTSEPLSPDADVDPSLRNLLSPPKQRNTPSGTFGGMKAGFSRISSMLSPSKSAKDPPFPGILAPPNIPITYHDILGWGRLMPFANVAAPNVIINKEYLLPTVQTGLTKKLEDRTTNITRNSDKLTQCLLTTTAKRGGSPFDGTSGPCRKCSTSSTLRQCVVVVDDHTVFLKGWTGEGASSPDPPGSAGPRITLSSAEDRRQFSGASALTVRHTPGTIEELVDEDEENHEDVMDVEEHGLGGQGL